MVATEKLTVKIISFGRTSHGAVRDIVLIVLSGVIGWFGLSISPRFSAPILAIPVFWGLARSRYAAFAVVLAYKLAASRGLLRGAAVFLSERHTLLQAAALYLLMSLGASLPFLLFWSRNGKRKGACLVVAFLSAYVLPPISLIGIVNPLIATGTILKGWGFFGILAMLAVYAACTVSRRVACCFLCVVALFTVFPAGDRYDAARPEGFVAIDTAFGRLGSGSFNFTRDYERIRMVFADLGKRSIKESGACCVVLPETIAGRLNTSGMDLWRDEMRRLLKDDMSVVFGAEIPTADGRKYDNAAILMHDGKVSVSRQRIPVPYSMYRGPFAETGANLHLLDDGILKLPDGRKAAVIICYESYLTWPWLVSMLRGPDMVIAMANLWWCRGTSLPATQRTVVSLWSLLFGVPLVFVENI